MPTNKVSAILAKLKLPVPSVLITSLLTPPVIFTLPTAPNDKLLPFHVTVEMPPNEPFALYCNSVLEPQIGRAHV